MSIASRQIAAAGVAGLALGIAAGPALASGSSSSSAVKAKTPLVAEITTQTSRLKEDYLNPDCNFSKSSTCEVDDLYMRDAIWSHVHSVAAVHADSAQLPAKLEWILGADLEAQGSGSLVWAEQSLVDHHNPPAQRRLIQAGLQEFRLANYYIADADSQLGVPHRTLEIEPSGLVGTDLTAADRKALIADLSTGSLSSTINSAAAVVDERVPASFGNVSYSLNEAAAAYYAVSVARSHVTPGQRSEQANWVKGADLLQQGDAQLDRTAQASVPPLSATIKHEVASAFTALRRANARFRRADQQLGIHHPGLTVALPTAVNGFKGAVGYPGVS